MKLFTRSLLILIFILLIPVYSFAGITLTVSWTNNATNQDGIAVERSLDGKTGWTEIGRTTVPTQNVYVDISSPTNQLLEKTQYCYQVRAYNVAGFSPYSNTACATTGSLPPNGTPGNVSVTATITP